MPKFELYDEETFLHILHTYINIYLKHIMDNPLEITIDIYVIWLIFCDMYTRTIHKAVFQVISVILILRAFGKGICELTYEY